MLRYAANRWQIDQTAEWVLDGLVQDYVKKQCYLSQLRHSNVHRDAEVRMHSGCNIKAELDKRDRNREKGQRKRTRMTGSGNVYKTSGPHKHPSELWVRSEMCSGMEVYANTDKNSLCSWRPSQGVTPLTPIVQLLTPLFTRRPGPASKHGRYSLPCVPHLHYRNQIFPSKRRQT